MTIKNTFSWLLKLTVAIILLQTLYFKFTAHPDSVHIFSALGVEPWGRITLGIIELITAFLILIPKTQVYGMLISLGIILGAVFSHFLVLGIAVANDGGGLFILAIIVLIAATTYLFLHKNDVVILLKKLKFIKN